MSSVGCIAALGLYLCCEMRERESGQARPVVTWLCSPQSLWAGNDNTATSQPGQLQHTRLTNRGRDIFRKKIQTKSTFKACYCFEWIDQIWYKIFFEQSFNCKNVCPCLLNCELALVCWLRAASLLCAAASSGSGPRSEKRSSCYTQPSSGSARHLAMGGTVCQPEDH